MLSLGSTIERGRESRALFGEGLARLLRSGVLEDEVESGGMRLGGELVVVDSLGIRVFCIMRDILAMVISFSEAGTCLGRSSLSDRRGNAEALVSWLRRSVCRGGL